MVLLCALTLVFSPQTRAGEYNLSVSAFGTLTTSSKLFPNPNARDDFLRGSFSPMNTIFSLGADIRGNVPPLGIRIGLSSELISRNVTSSVPNTGGTIPIEDGYTAVPVELTGYFRIPVGGESLDFYMGGGGGVYLGGRRYRYAGVEAGTLDRSLNFGIHVLSGLEVRLAGRFALRTELKFRNIQLETSQRFSAAVAVYRETTVPLPQEILRSRIQIDGMNLVAGIVYRLP
ncbi:MAG TPA: hypothetical protein VJO14_07935 [Bacteroidota bacterium]|nr:hypothetical protein [Bacteroidota bacterium]